MKTFIAGLGVVFSFTLGASAALIFGDDFNSYGAGNLVGQGFWQQTGTVTTSPIQISGGKVFLGTSGQDVNAPFGQLNFVDGNSFYFGATINVSAAQGGDYFMHWAPGPSGNSSAFFSRMYIKASGAGFLLGYLPTAAGTGGTTNYGSTVLNFNQDYRMVVSYNMVAGAANDTVSVYVNPTDNNVEGNNTAYIASAPWSSAFGETNNVMSINLRQGTASIAASLSVDDIVVGTAYSDVTVIPEQATLSIAILGVASLFAAARIRRQN